MKCDLCDNEATVHEVTVHKGEKLEKHLCEQCAKEDGLGSHSNEPVSAMLSKFVLSGGGGKGGLTKTLSCPGCGLTYAEFRQHGLVGCAECYNTFQEQLSSLLERAQEGGSQHVGKTPVRSRGSLDRQQRLASLRRQLSEAISAEQYERAAELRDELRSVTEGGGRSFNEDAPAEERDA